MPTQDVRLALVGVGRWGRVLLRVLGETPGVRLVAVVSGQPTDALSLPAGTEHLRRWADLLARGPTFVDGVVLATPPSTHARLLTEGVQAGLAVFVEKPLATTWTDAQAAERIVGSDTAERGAAERGPAERGPVVLVDHTQLFHPAYAVLRAHVQAAGTIEALATEGGQRNVFPGDTGALWDYGPHETAIAADLLAASGETTGLRLDSARSVQRLDIGAHIPAETVELRLTTGHGAPVSLRFGSLIEPKRRRVFVRLPGELLLLDEQAPDALTRHAPNAQQISAHEISADRTDAVVWPDAADGTPIPYPAGRPLQRAIARFVTGIRGDLSGTPAFGLTLGVEVVRLLTEAERLLARA